MLGVAQEGELVEQVVEAVRVEHDRDQVGPVALVVAHELAGEQHARPGQPRPQQGDQALLAGERDAGPGQRGPVAGQVGADRRLARLDQRDLPVSELIAATGRPMLSAGCCWRACSCAELGVELPEARVGARGHRDRGRTAAATMAAQATPSRKRGSCAFQSSLRVPTGLAVGLARRLRYTAIRPRFAPGNFGSPAFPLSAGNSASGTLQGWRPRGRRLCLLRAWPPIAHGRSSLGSARRRRASCAPTATSRPGAPRVAGAVLHGCDDPPSPGTGSCAPTGRWPRAGASARCWRPRASRSAAPRVDMRVARLPEL